MILFLVACAGQQGNNRATKGVYHSVKKGETLSQIARAYHVDPKKLAEINHIRRPDNLEESSAIFIPDAVNVVDIRKTVKVRTGEEHAKRELAKKGIEKKRLSASVKKEIKPGANGGNPVAPIKTEIQKRQQPRSMDENERDNQRFKPKETVKDASPPDPSTPLPTVTPDVVVDSSKKGIFAWPVRGRVTTRFGRQPNGMFYNHIGIAARDHASIVAAAAGTVIFSAPLKDFGETIIIKHSNDFATVYTHMGSRSVKADISIKKGEVIGLVGKSEKKGEGYIHFEIRQSNKAKNPLLYLP